jgi:large subunit ribosomal protein L14e
MTVNVKLEPGDIVRSRRGKDEGQLVIVIALVEERFALVADGDKRRFDRPKRKNVLHLEPIGTRSEEVANSLRDTGRVTNAKLRFAIGQIEQRLVTTDSRSLSDAQSDALEMHAVEKGE